MVAELGPKSPCFSASFSRKGKHFDLVARAAARRVCGSLSYVLGMSHRYMYAGACHCGNIALRLESDKAPRELGLRADGCSFCSKHNALYTSDPGGAVHIAVQAGEGVERYRFGTKTADFLLCKTCGVFVAAAMTEPALAVINVNVLDARAAFLENQVQTADFEGESLEQRLARRRARWTPLVSFVAR